LVVLDQKFPFCYTSGIQSKKEPGMITKETANFLLNMVYEQIADAEVYVNGGEDNVGYYADLLIELKQARQQLLDLVL